MTTTNQTILLIDCWHKVRLAPEFRVLFGLLPRLVVSPRLHTDTHTHARTHARTPPPPTHTTTTISMWNKSHKREVFLSVLSPWVIVVYPRIHRPYAVGGAFLLHMKLDFTCIWARPVAKGGGHGVPPPHFTSVPPPISQIVMISPFC